MLDKFINFCINSLILLMKDNTLQLICTSECFPFVVFMIYVVRYDLCSGAKFYICICTIVTIYFFDIVEVTGKATSLF